MKGKQYIYGGQLNFTYKILDCLSAAFGIRANYYDGYYRGHVIADAQNEYGQLAKLLLDVEAMLSLMPKMSMDNWPNCYLTSIRKAGGSHRWSASTTTRDH